MLSTTISLALLSGLRAVSAQSFTVTSFSESTELVFPTGVADSSSQTESSIPLACAPGCLPVTQPYYPCFINTTQLDGSTIPETFCEDFFCSQSNYNQLVDCANCVIANGGERPLGYHTNTSLTAAPTTANFPGAPFNPLGLVDEEQLNGWIRNVTERCSSVNRPVTGSSTVTATATTTGPYYASFESGQTQSLPTWTGLTQYSAAVWTLRVPVEEGASGDGSIASNTGSPTSSAAAASSSASGSGSSDAGNGVSRKEGSVFFAILSGVLAYVVAV